VCSRCGRSFIPKKAKVITKKLNRDISHPSVPPASPYRAGHYAGFHPEDQPYESGIIAIQHPAEPEQRSRVQQEPEHIVFPATTEVAALKKEREQDVPKRAARLTHLRAQVRLPARVRLPTSVPGRQLFSARVISLGLTLSCIVFLLAASIIAFVLIGKHRTEATAIVKAAPDTVRVGDVFTLLGSGFTVGDVMTFTYDGSTPILNERGQPINARINQSAGFSVLIPVPERWTAGTHIIDALDTTAGMDASTQITVLAASSEPPTLQLAQTQLQFPEAAAGVVSSQFVVLTNSGGGRLIWHAQSDQPWLTLTSDHDTFAGRERVQITVNRGTLAVQAYTGHVVFTQQDSRSAPLTLTVQMVVKPAQPALAISRTALSYTANPLHNAASQFITLRNDSKGALSWTTSVAINENTPWLTLTPGYGQLGPGDSKTIVVGIRARNLMPGIYQGTINFTGGADAQVHVNLNVFAATNNPTASDPVGSSSPVKVATVPVLPPTAQPTAQPTTSPPVSVIIVDSTTMHFSTTQGQNPAAQSVTITNSGAAALQWGATVSNDAGDVFTITPAQGNLAAGESTKLTVNANVSGADPGTLTATVTIGGGASIPSRTIAVDVTINKAQSALSVSSTALTCSDASDASASRQFSITNKGSGSVHWSLQPASTGAGISWLSFDPTSGVLAAGDSTTVSINCDNSGLSTDNYTATIDVVDSDAGAVVKPVTITFIVS